MKYIYPYKHSTVFERALEDRRNFAIGD